MKKFFVKCVSCLIPSRVWCHALSGYFLMSDCCTVRIVENGKERPARLSDFRFLHIMGSGKNNKVSIELPQWPSFYVHIAFVNCFNSQIVFHERCAGSWAIHCHDWDNRAEIGPKANACSVEVLMLGNTLKIGENCLIAGNIRILGDGHAVLEWPSGKCLNDPSGTEISVGNRCWLGERVTLTKNAQIPDDSIVGVGAVVTKKFTEHHTIIAGCPARVCKTGICWDGASPLTYKKNSART